MIKKAKKSVAIGLSVALAVTSVNIPVDSASAAAKKAKLSATKKTLTAGKSTTLTLKTNKKKAKTIKTIKAKYVKVSTSKKSVATVKKVSKKSKVTGIKVTAKKAGTATITVKVTKGTYKGTYKCKVTVKKKASATKKPTQKPTEVPTATPEVTVEPTVEPATTPAITEAPTAEPSTSPAITVAPTETPAAVKYVVTKADNIIKDGDAFKVTLSFDTDVEAKADVLKDSVLTLTGVKTVKAVFDSLDADGKAVYKITDADDVKALKPFDTTSNGTYKVTSNSEVLVLDNITAEYEEALVGNAVAGYVVTKNATTGKYEPVKNATVKIDGGQSVKTNEAGYYKIASVNGQKKIEVSADGYLDNSGNRVYVNRNHVTSQNFEMENFDNRKVFANITIKDSETKKAVKGARVYLYKDGKEVGGLTDNDGKQTDNDGKFTYANSLAADASLATGSALQQKTNTTYLEKGATYTVMVEKRLSPSNFDDVYMMKEVGSFTVGNKYDNSQEFYATKVKKTPSMTLTQVLADDDVLKQVSITGSNSDAKAMTVSYSVYTNVYGGDGDNLLKLFNVPVTVDKSADIKDKAVDVELIEKVFNKKGEATLPTGDYFVVVDPKDQKDNDSIRVAKGAVKISVKEGEAATGKITITKGYLREFVTNVALTPAQEKPQDLTAVGEPLYVIESTADGYQRVTPAKKVSVDYDIKQVVDGVRVPIEAAANGKAVVTNEKKAFVAESQYDRLLGDGKYEITSKGDYVVAVNQTEEVNNKSNKTLTYNTDGAWKMVQATIKVGSNNEFIKDAATGNYRNDVAADFAVTKVVAKNVNTGESTTIYEAAANTTGIIPNCSVNKNVASASAITDDNKVEAGKYLVYDLSDAAKKVNLKDGSKYTFTYTFKEYGDITSEYTPIGLEDVKDSTDGTFTKKTADKTAISGVITVKDDAGKISNVNGTVTATSGAALGVNNYKPLVMLLDKDGKISGLSTVTAAGEYAIIDSVDGNTVKAGTYKLVVRGFGYETKVIDVTVNENQQLTEGIQLEKGGVGAIKAYVTDTQKNVIGDINSSYAFDKYAIVDKAEASFVNKALASKIDLHSNDYDTGIYTGKANGKILEFNYLSAGEYTVKAGSALTGGNYGYSCKYKDTYDFVDKSVIIKSNGDKQYPEWTFAKKGDKDGQDLVDLTVKFSGVDTEAAVTDKVFVITVTDKDGRQVVDPTMTKQNNSSPVTIKVPSASTEATVTYTVTLYTLSGKQVASNTVPVQRVDTSVVMAVNDATVD